MKPLLFYFFLFIGFVFHAQILNLPARQVTAMNGSQFVSTITPMSFSARENLIMQNVLSGNIPSFYRILSPVTSTATIAGFTKSVTYYVIPDYLAIGCDTNYFLCPMSPIIATQIADSIGCTLPTRKMVNDIYAQAALKLTPLTIPASGTMTTVQAFAQHNAMVGSQRSGLVTPFPLGTLVGGDKKDVIISNQIYTTANRVIIYGWHTSVGNPIQPLTNVHADTYMDYSHGMRFVQNSVQYNGSATTIRAMLQSSTQYVLLSDEGVISQPQYPYSTPLTSLATPKSFAVLKNGATSLELKVRNDNNATHYKIYLSNNGVAFNSPILLAKNSLTLTGLTANQVQYVKIAAYNSTYSVTSSNSELLAATPSVAQDSLLVVNGFDRVVSGNTFDFIKQHAASAFALNHLFFSATNEAVQDGRVNLGTFKAVDWILGKESTSDETFNSAEQTLVANYLKQGGKLFVSGSEIAWDLDYNGTVADKSFFSTFLKSAYVADAPNGLGSAFYKCVKVPQNSIFSFSDTINYDNGTHGTFNVDYPDVISAVNGSSVTLKYTNTGANGAGVYFGGMFPGGTVAGKLVYLSFPLESVYDATKRTSLLYDVWNYFYSAPTATITPPSSTGIKNYNDVNADVNIYPNPANGYLQIKSSELIQSILITSVDGSMIQKYSGSSTVEVLNISAYPPGIYFVTVQSYNSSTTKKIIKE